MATKVLIRKTLFFVEIKTVWESCRYGYDKP